MLKDKIQLFGRSFKTAVTLRQYGLTRQLVAAAHDFKIDSVPKRPMKVAVIAPHPDDDIFGLGGTIALHRQNNHEVTVVFVSDGSRGTKDGSRNLALVKTRQQEAQKALVHLGEVKTVFWGIEDGKLGDGKSLGRKAKEFLASMEFDRIYLPWFGEQNTDHEAVSHTFLQKIAQAKLAAEVWQYEIWTPLVPNRVIAIQETVKQKQQAILEHKSQLNDRNYQAGVTGLSEYRGMIYDTNGPAEAFLVINPGFLVKNKLW